MCCSFVLFLYGLIADYPKLITGGLVFTACMMGTYIGGHLKEDSTEGMKQRRTIRLLYIQLTAEIFCLAAMLFLIVASLSDLTDFPTWLVIGLTISSLIVLYGIKHLLPILKTKK